MNMPYAQHNYDQDYLDPAAGQHIDNLLNDDGIDENNNFYPQTPGGGQMTIGGEFTPSGIYENGNASLNNDVPQ